MTMILAVDDEPDMLRALKRALAPLTSDVTTTSDPLMALDILSQYDVDVLVSDIDMPLMNGHELMRRARATRPDVVRILLTGRPTVESAMRAINEGEVHRYVSKPFDPTELRSVVSGALERRAALAQAARVAVEGDRQRSLLARLEASHPGIGQVTRDGQGAYVVVPARAAAGAAAARQAGLLVRGCSW
ncbi:MAG TPA: response regulator [Kofleriaceae bacterium]|nr:response regulator [Kofleriaceae bacterium]